MLSVRKKGYDHMENVILAAAMCGIFLFGYVIMKKLDEVLEIKNTRDARKQLIWELRKENKNQRNSL